MFDIPEKTSQQLGWLYEYSRAELCKRVDVILDKIYNSDLALITFDISPGADIMRIVPLGNRVEVCTTTRDLIGIPYDVLDDPTGAYNSWVQNMYETKDARKKTWEQAQQAAVEAREQKEYERLRAKFEGT